ncbi:hypothetical protein ACKTEK_05015 [Tepidamorphus sp. 3E244]|uniref:hypothetical protein n=1 Tax=Tepidamorphus sp. 3E244 TaxID=3385498 RepID=UPI0038FCF547
MTSTIRVGLAGLVVDIALRDEPATALAHVIFSRFPTVAARDPCLRLELVGDGADQFALWREGSPVFTATCSADAARLVLAEVIHAFASHCTAIPLLHAAAVCGSHSTILLPGTSGAGKSTLCARLDNLGYACVSDELIGISDPCHVLAFPRPICLKPDADRVLSGIIQDAARTGRLLRSDEALVLSPRTALPDPVPAPCAIVFASYAPSEPQGLQPISKAAAVVRLMGSVANARQLPDHGFEAITNLTRTVAAYSLNHTSADDGAKAIRALIPQSKAALDGSNVIVSQSAAP